MWPWLRRGARRLRRGAGVDWGSTVVVLVTVTISQTVDISRSSAADDADVTAAAVTTGVSAATVELEASLETSRKAMPVADEDAAVVSVATLF